MRDAILTAGGAALIAVLNEVRAQLRARQATRERADFREELAAAPRYSATKDSSEG